MSTPAASSFAVRIRLATPEDAPVAGHICFEAFRTISAYHNFPPDFPNADVAIGLLGALFSHPGFHCVVAEASGRIVGSNCLDERSTIAGVGPITVEPSVQNGSVGTLLMRTVLDRARERGFPGVRLLQSAFHGRSLSLYTKLGFDAREPMSVMQGPRLSTTIDGYRVRSATAADVEAMNRLCERVHGHTRAGELRDALTQGTVRVVERHDRITGYTSGIGFFGHTVAESNDDLQALIASADAFGGPGLIVPTRNSDLFRWCLNHGLRVVQPLTLMSLGLYNEPNGAYLPSILY
jgi:predicted N-acetyltransferase YhbS